jgi:hypothetical protein
MEKYIVFWTLMIITQAPCDKSIKGKYINDTCFVNDTITINREMKFDSLNNAIRFQSRLGFIEGRKKIIDSISLQFFESPQRVLIDSVWNNDFAEVYKKVKR